MTAKMILVFNSLDAANMTKGETAIWASHASLWLEKYMTTLILTPNNHGFAHMKLPLNTQEHAEWLASDYRKIALISKSVSLQADNLAAIKLGLNTYLQLSAHDGNYKCLACFGENKLVDKFTKGMVLLK